MAADGEHQRDHRWHEQHHYPSTGHELDDSHDQHGCVSGGCAEPIHYHAKARITILILQPMSDYPALRQGKSQECPDRKAESVGL
jgi:hypothetical protein